MQKYDSRLNFAKYILGLRKFESESYFCVTKKKFLKLIIYFINLNLNFPTGFTHRDKVFTCPKSTFLKQKSETMYNPPGSLKGTLGDPTDSDSDTEIFQVFDTEPIPIPI